MEDVETTRPDRLLKALSNLVLMDRILLGMPWEEVEYLLAVGLVSYSVQNSIPQEEVIKNVTSIINEEYPIALETFNEVFGGKLGKQQ